MDIRKAAFMKCTGSAGPVTGQSECGTCESCVLNNKLNFTKEWFTRVSENTRQKFMRKLLNSCNSLELISALLEQLKPLQSKDFTYARSKTNAVFDLNLSTSIDNSDKGLSHIDLGRYISEDRHWFETASSWSKLNYLFKVFQFCNAFTLDSFQQLLCKKYETARKSSAKSMSASTKRYSAKTSESYHGILDEDNVNFINENSIANRFQSDLPEKKSEKLTRSSVTFSPTLQEYFKEEAPHLNEDFELQSKEIRIISSQSSRRTQGSRLSARCYPYRARKNESRYPNSNGDSDSDDYLSLDDLAESSNLSLFRNVYRSLPKQRDFIRRLPVHLSKRILGFLDVNSLVNCVCVSKHWRFLAEEVKSETLTQQIMREDVMLIKGSTESIPNPLYARIVPLHVPKLSESGEIIMNKQAKHVDVTSENEEFENKDMQNCYEGIETVIVDVEEKNIYCGAYNVLVLNQSKDNCRVTYYDGGKFVPVASMDRRIRLLDVTSGRCEKTITEHVGSVKSVCTDESRGFVISGSYDTTIRLWDIKTGRCQRIFLGHKSSVISLSLHDRYLASGSTDKTCRVWNMKTGKCIRTFRHRNVILSVSIGGKLLLTGCAAGKVRIWDFKAAKLIKSLDGHMGPITCARFDENHIVTGSKDCYAMAWSAKGDFKRCLRTFRHPKEVNCLELMYCRIITGSADGKIRLWNLLDGECLRIIRGNSRNDPITALYASEDRLIVNTRSNLLLYNFEPIDWDYKCPADRPSEFVQSSSSNIGDQRIKNHAFNRAQKLRRKGSGWIQDSNINDLTNASNTQASKQIERSMRVNSAPVRPATDSVQKHISRVQSAVTQRKSIMKQTDFAERPKQRIIKNNERESIECRDESQSANIGLLCEVSPLKTVELDKETTPNSNVPRVIARSRSAPAHRTRTLPPNEKGFTSSSDIQVRIQENRLGSSKQRREFRKVRPFSAVDTALKNPTDVFCDLKLKSFYQQLSYQEELTQQRI